MKTFDAYRKYFKPLEILQAEIAELNSEQKIVLNLTQFWHFNTIDANNIILNLQHFSDIIVGDRQFEAPDIDVLINRFALYQVEPVEKMDAFDKTHILFGVYWGDSEKEALYSLDYFRPSYWGDEVANCDRSGKGEFRGESLSLFESIRNFLNLRK